MPPTVSLFLVAFLILVITYLRRKIRREKPAYSVMRLKISLVFHLLLCLASGVAVWCLNLLAWQEWQNQLAVLLLLVLVGFSAGIVTATWLYGRFWETLALAPYENRPLDTPFEREATYSFAREMDDQMPSGVIHIRKYGQVRGHLPSGNKVVWDDATGRWRKVEESRRKIS